MDKYLINSSTILVKPISKNKTFVMEKYVNYEIDESTLNIIDNSCRYYGSSLVGRCAGTEYLIGIKYKCPIIISENKALIMFPTSSFKNVDTMWINHNYLTKFYNKDHITILEFANGQKVNLDVSSRVISNQVLKSSRLESILRSKNH